MPFVFHIYKNVVHGSLYLSYNQIMQPAFLFCVAKDMFLI